MIFNSHKVTRIYTGRDRICRCGCAGEYVERGEPMFDVRLKRFCKLLENYLPKDGDIFDTYNNISYGKDRAITVYFD